MTPAAAAATQAAVPAAGPYDPNAYKPAASLASANANSTDSAGTDRYGLSSASTEPGGGASCRRARRRSRAIRLTDMVRRPRSRRQPPRPAPHRSRIRPRWPPIDTRIQHCHRCPANRRRRLRRQLSTPATSSAGSIASAPGQYRPGRTSSYTSAAATSPIEVASSACAADNCSHNTCPSCEYRTRCHQPALAARAFAGNITRSQPNDAHVLS